MTMFFGALALALAVPAAAQTAPAADPHAQHKAMGHAQHDKAKHDCKDCCDKMKQSGGKMECMDKQSEAKSPAPAPAADSHAGHAH